MRWLLREEIDRQARLDGYDRTDCIGFAWMVWNGAKRNRTKRGIGDEWEIISREALELELKLELHREWMNEHILSWAWY